MDFTNKNIVITGGSSGIGFATAKGFINAGANVWITGRSADKLQKAAGEINSPNLKTLVADTSKLSGIAVLEKAFAESGNKLDVLYLNAGVGVYTPIELTTEADFDAQFDTNVKGMFFTLQKLIPYLANGALVLFTSSAVAQLANVNSGVYAATKAAVSKIAQVAANELADRKIRVNIISPGPINTPGLDSVVPAEAKEHLVAGTPLQRIGKPEEIANTILFLASDKASFISGANLSIDGGILNYMLK